MSVTHRFVLSLVVLIMTVVSHIWAEDYYRSLPTYTGSVNELNGKGIWTHVNDFEEKTTRRPEKMHNGLNFDIDQIMNDMGSLPTSRNDTFFRAQQKDSWLTTVKIIPDEHHVSAFLNKGFVKR